MRAFVMVIATMCLAAAIGTFFTKVGEANHDIVIAKAERVRILASPVVRVCQDGTYIRAIANRLYVGHPRAGGWAKDGLAADAICNASAT